MEERHKIIIYSNMIVLEGHTEPHPLHRHYYLQLFLEEQEPGHWEIQIIPSNQPHSLGSRGRRYYSFLVDPLTPLGHLLVGRAGGNLKASKRSLLPFVTGDGDSGELWTESQWHSHLTELLELDKRESPADAMDFRIQRVLKHLAGKRTPSLSIQEACRLGGLSESYFYALFRREVGIPFRRYQGYLRLGRAVREILGGASLTTSAVAYFCDQAHFCRTFKEAFGIPAGILFKNNRFVQVIDGRNR